MCMLFKNIILAFPDLTTVHGRYVSNLVRQEVQAGIDSKRVVVAGFSQVHCSPLLGRMPAVPPPACIEVMCQ